MKITIDLPTPSHTVSDRGFTYLDDFPHYHERSTADRPVVEIDGVEMDCEEAEAQALAILWLVRNHYQEHGLKCETKKSKKKNQETSDGLPCCGEPKELHLGGQCP